MLKKCIGSDQEYETSTHFVTYTIEKSNGKRSYVMQFVKEESGGEQFHCYYLFDPAPGTGEEREFQRRYRIINADDLVKKLFEEGTRHAMNIIPKGNCYLLERIHQSFCFPDTVRATGLAQALNRFTQPFVEGWGININPVELTISLFEQITIIKVENSCRIL